MRTFIFITVRSYLLVPATSTTLHLVLLHHEGCKVQYDDEALLAHPSSGNRSTWSEINILILQNFSIERVHTS